MNSKQEKTKEYRTFAFPNKLTPLETFYYYLREFEVIPERIDSKRAESIFFASSKDYLEGYLPLNSFSLVAEYLALGMVKQGDLPPCLFRLMVYCAEMEEEHIEEQNAIKKLLTIYVQDNKKLEEMYQEGTFDNVFTE